MIVIKAFSGEGDYPEIQKALELAARQIERIIDINVIGLNSDISPNIAVIPLTPETITSLKNTEWVGLDTSYVDMTLPKVLSENGCAARILINENNEKLDEIRFVYLFANPKTDLNACILEELINGIGIFADPPNYSSLFDSPRHMLMSGYTLNRNTHRLIRFHYSDFPKTIWGWLWFKANR